MKLFIYTAILVFSINTMAQRPGERGMKSNFTPEQQAELQTKRMALALDLDPKQIDEIKALHLERAKERETFRELRRSRRNSDERPSQEELFSIRDKQLDAQIDHQNKIKKILSKEQYKTWKAMRNERRGERPSKSMRQGSMGRRGRMN